VKIYTRTGDTGSTGLFGGQRVSKNHARVRAYGAVDELNAVLGLAAIECARRAADSPNDGTAPGMSQLAHRLDELQSRLFDVGADLATPPGTPAERAIVRVPAAWAADLEADIDRIDRALPPLQAFILPGGSEVAARLHHARTVCRRAEREVVAAREAGADIGDEPVRLLNRLSDWLFVAAREANRVAGVPDTPWTAAVDPRGAQPRPADPGDPTS